jgi:hypothetical protein
MERRRPTRGSPSRGRPCPRGTTNGSVGTGQSLSVGAQARDIASIPQAFGNLMLRLPAKTGRA